MRDAHPNGVDAVLDIINGPAASKGNALCLKPGARLVSTVLGANAARFSQSERDALGSSTVLN